MSKQKDIIKKSKMREKIRVMESWLSFKIKLPLTTNVVMKGLMTIIMIEKIEICYYYYYFKRATNIVVKELKTVVLIW